MKNELDGRRHSDSPLSLPAFTVCPTVRCTRRLGDEAYQVCGQPATHVVRGKWWFEDRGFCAACAPETAEPLPADLAVRRVRLTLEVYVAGTHGSAPAAQQEALAHVQAALEAAGAIVEVLEARSTFGRYPAPVPVPARTARPGIPT